MCITKCESVQLMLEGLGGQRGALRPQLEGLEQDVSQLKEWASGLSEKRAQLQTSVTSLRDARDFGAFEPQLSDLTLRIGRLAEDLMKREQEIAELRQTLANLTAVEGDLSFTTKQPSTMLLKLWSCSGFMLLLSSRAVSLFSKSTTCSPRLESLDSGSVWAPPRAAMLDSSSLKLLFSASISCSTPVLTFSTACPCAARVLSWVSCLANRDSILEVMSDTDADSESPISSDVLTLTSSHDIHNGRELLFDERRVFHVPQAGLDISQLALRFALSFGELGHAGCDGLTHLGQALLHSRLQRREVPLSGLLHLLDALGKVPK
ncbi:hypothetical protein FQN60_005789 [Etheostoma spectabile]|uniref:Uncharacterized protein n=1 Tax=Etheostoma spectabile TaxID=54343 RepID=A0A5J5CE92_9PERO|nr:hypothetical protein FQN60_005789 [Etheostoma spectabile]